MEAIEARMQEFVAYVAMLRGDEKREAQLSCDQLFKVCGHASVEHEGATLEERVSMGRGARGRKRSAELKFRAPNCHYRFK